MNNNKINEIAKIVNLPVEQLQENSKELTDLDAVYYYNPVRGGISVIVSNSGDFLAANSSISFDKLLAEFKNGRRNGKLNDGVFTSYAGMNSDEIKELITEKINLLNDKLNGNIDEQEKANDGYLFWNCKMILRNIYMSCDKLVNKFADQLTADEITYFKNMSNIIKVDEGNLNSIEDIKNIAEKI